MSEHPVHDALRAYAERLEAETSPGTAHRAVRRALGAPPGRMRLRRVAVLLASALGFGLGNAALALAVQPSVPGDALYGVERAYERVAALVGVRLGSPEERLSEAAVLLRRGDVVGARELVAEAVAEVPVAVRVVEAVPPEAVHELIEPARVVVEAAETGDPEAVGEAVAEMQAELTPSTVPPPKVSPEAPPGLEGAPGGEKGAPGRTGDPTGPPDDLPGPPDDVAPPAGSGGDVPGPPATPGPPEGPGPPSGTPGRGGGTP